MLRGYASCIYAPANIRRDMISTQRSPVVARHPTGEGVLTIDTTTVRQPIGPQQQPAIGRSPTARFIAIWNAAIKDYQEITDIEIVKIDIAKLSPELADRGLLTADRLWEIIDDEQSYYREYRSRGQDLRRALMPALYRIWVISNHAAGKSSWRPSETIFIAIKLLFDAAGNVGARYEAIMDVFYQITGSLDKYTSNRDVIDIVTVSLQKRLVDILAQVLLIIGMLTMRRPKGKLALLVLSRLPNYIDPAQDALERLTYLTRYDNLTVRRDTVILP
ncbi:hypothetical protein DENSPDRAFT_839797 [Dentipellis sp. KUC8613]|nr:hypothetical protein DENSPDRAFT_839797 [Dentipellis sp. KUC8613]